MAMKIQSGTARWFSDEGARLDASFHLSEGRVARKFVERSPLGIMLLSKASKRIFLGARFKRVYVNSPENGYPYLTASDMTKSEPLSGNYLSKKHTRNISLLEIKKGWILISCSGSIGRTVYTNDLFEGQIGTHDLIRVEPNPSVVPPGYLYAYLASRYGYTLLTKGTYGGVIQHIEPHHIAGIPVPLLPEAEQQRIHDLVEEAARLRVEANEALRNVIEVLETTYDLKDERKLAVFSTPIASILTGDKFTNEKRLEADNYQPRTQKVIKNIKNIGDWALLGDVCYKIVISDIRYRNFVKNGIPFFTGQSLGLLQPDYSKQLSKTLTRNIKKNLTIDGDILISAFGTLGKIELVYKNFYTGIFPSQQIAKVECNPNMIHPGFVFLFLKSKVGQEQIMRFKTGSVIEWLNSHNIASIVVPIPADKGIALGQKAYEIVKQIELAYKKEKEAIEIIESTISSW